MIIFTHQKGQTKGQKHFFAWLYNTRFIYWRLRLLLIGIFSFAFIHYMCCSTGMRFRSSFFIHNWNNSKKRRRIGQERKCVDCPKLIIAWSALQQTLNLNLIWSDRSSLCYHVPMWVHKVQVAATFEFLLSPTQQSLLIATVVSMQLKLTHATKDGVQCNSPVTMQLDATNAN